MKVKGGSCVGAEPDELIHSEFRFECEGTSDLSK